MRTITELSLVEEVMIDYLVMLLSTDWFGPLAEASRLKWFGWIVKEKCIEGTFGWLQAPATKTLFWFQWVEPIS